MFTPISHPILGAGPGDTYARSVGGLHKEGEDRYLTITYRRNTEAVGVEVTVQESANLENGSWTTVEPDQIVEVGTDPITGDSILEIRVPIGPEDQKFIRLRVVQAN